MPSLKVLLLHDNPLTELPLGIPKLASLQLLDLSFTKIKELPIELKSLINLKYLALEKTYDLSSIPRKLISNFSKLNILRMANCSLRVHEEAIAEDSILFGGSEFLVEEMFGLKRLYKLSIDLGSFLALQRFLSSLKLQSYTEHLSLHFDDSKMLKVSSLLEFKDLFRLEIRKCKYLEELIDHVTVQPYSFYSLRQVIIEFCPKLRDLTWIVFSRNLNFLKIFACDEMEELISAGKLGEVMESLNPFANLSELSLRALPNLKSICPKALTCPHLVGIYVDNCPNLKKLPLHSNSTNEHTLVIQGEERWWEELQWEDEATKNVYLPCFESL